MKIALVINSLASKGGAQLVLSTIANYWASKGFNISIATFDDGEKGLACDLSHKIQLDFLNLSSELKSRNIVESILKNKSRINILQKYFLDNNPDLIISFLSGVNVLVLLSTLNNKIPVIISERNYPVYTLSDPIRNRLRKWLYPKASAIVCQTEKMLDYFLPELIENAVVIPNPVLKHRGSSIKNAKYIPNGKVIIAIGSMTKKKVYQKGFDLLIPVFGNLAKKHKDWNLIILGEGSQRMVLNQEKDVFLKDRLIFPGHVHDLTSILKQGDLFVLSSRYEGFPNALCEAMACGLPAVSFDCPSGPSDIIRNGIDGVLVPPEDVKGLESSLDLLMDDELMREQMGSKAKEIIERFSLEKVMTLWEDLIINVKYNHRKKT